MVCKCATLFLDNKKYLVKCNDCKNIIGSTDNELDGKSDNKYQFRWYEKHIEIQRDNPEIRMGIELLLLIGWAFMLGLCWLEWLKITSSFGNFTLNLIGTICTIWIILLFGYLDAYQKLCTNPKFFL
jgi:hypothetical protein